MSEGGMPHNSTVRTYYEENCIPRMYKKSNIAMRPKFELWNPDQHVQYLM